jgi:pimeloyl-ACP methyl ester carboxylesterase
MIVKHLWRCSGHSRDFAALRRKSASSAPQKQVGGLRGLLHLLTDAVTELSPDMRLGSLTNWLKTEPRDWSGPLFKAHGHGPALVGGRPVLFVHGLAASPECWEGAVTHLPGVRAELVHMRGFSGASPTMIRQPMNFLKPVADELASYIRWLDRGPVAVCGHSMGGIVSMILARDHPHLVEKLMVADVPAFFSALINPFATAAAMGSLAEASRRRYVERASAEHEDELRKSVAKLVQDPVIQERVVRWGLMSDRATTADVMAEVMVTDLRPDLARITAPTDVVYAWDRNGPVTRAGVDQFYQASYSGLADKRLVRVDNARHYLMFDQPRAFYDAVRDWLAR